MGHGWHQGLAHLGSPVRRARSRAGRAAPSPSHGPGRAGQVSVSKGWGLLCICCHYDSPVGTGRKASKPGPGLAPAAPHAAWKKEGREEARAQAGAKQEVPWTERGRGPVPAPRGFSPFDDLQKGSGCSQHPRSGATPMLSPLCARRASHTGVTRRALSSERTPSRDTHPVHPILLPWAPPRSTGVG